MGRCHYCRGATNCLHRDDGPSGQCLPREKPRLFILNRHVIQSAEIDKERIRILDGLGINMKDMPELRMALLGTETHKTSGKTVYSRRIYWCACHVNSNDMIAGSHPGSLKCKPGIKFLSMKESRERLALLTFVSPQLKHASPLASHGRI